MRSLVVLIIVAPACGTTIQSIPVNPPPHALVPRRPEAVELFTASMPSRDFVEVAYLEVEQESLASQDGPPVLFAKLRAHAGAMGCDALYIKGPNNRTVEGVDGAHTLLGYAATCLVYR